MASPFKPKHESYGGDVLSAFQGMGFAEQTLTEIGSAHTKEKDTIPLSEDLNKVESAIRTECDRDRKLVNNQLYKVAGAAIEHIQESSISLRDIANIKSTADADLRQSGLDGVRNFKRAAAEQRRIEREIDAREATQAWSETDDRTL